eukprot:9489267-Ditylum_brightwellii.AAC.1
MAVKINIQDITTTTQSKQTQKKGPSKKATSSPLRNELLKIKNVTVTKTGNRFTAAYSIDGKKL